MSYYNYVFKAKKLESYSEVEESGLVFEPFDSGYQDLKDFVGENKVSFHEDGCEYIYLEECSGGSDYIRPYDLKFGLSNNKPTFQDASYFVPVKDMHNRIDWSSVEDIDKMEEALKSYQEDRDGDELVFPL